MTFDHPAFLISLPEATDRREQASAELSPLFPHLTVSPGIRPDPANILWSQIRGMEAYHRIENFRENYIPSALGCRLAGLAAIESGIATRADGFFIFQDDVEIPDGQHFSQTLGHLLSLSPDCIWLDIGQVQRGFPVDQKTQRLASARLCTGMWLSRRYAEELLPRLRTATTEWDLFHEHEMPFRTYLAPTVSILRQRSGLLSQITGQRKP